VLTAALFAYDLAALDVYAAAGRRRITIIHEAGHFEL
jgi:hypothetical protein